MKRQLIVVPMSCHRPGDASSRHRRLGLRRSTVRIVRLGNAGLQNVPGDERRRRLHRLQDGWVFLLQKPQTLRTSVHVNWASLLHQGTKAASWTVCQNPQRASRRRPPKPSAATSSSGRSPCPTSEAAHHPSTRMPSSFPVPYHRFLIEKHLFFVHGFCTV